MKFDQYGYPDCRDQGCQESTGFDPWGYPENEADKEADE